MKLTGDLKKQVESESTREGIREIIKKAGMLLTDEELDQVAGGKRVKCGNDGLRDTGSNGNG
ncbi:MAG: hypothetical protein K6G83_14315 [Lachnospiraceae bacterium]|nr:hypothetical protein [Lachnospiraceae bacterium]